MFVIAEPYIRFDTSIESTQLRRGAVAIEKLTESKLRDYFGSERYESLGITIVVRVETGSTRSWFAIGGLVLTTLGTYGSIRQSVDYLVHDARYIGSQVLPRVAPLLGLGDERAASQQRRLGAPGQLRDLFRRVESGELSAEEATARALGVLYDRVDVDEMARCAHWPRAR